MLCAGDDFTMFHPVTRNVCVEPVQVVPAGFGTTIDDSEGARFRVALGKHQFAADTIFELPLALDYKHFGAMPRHVDREGCTAQAAAGDGQIVSCRHVISFWGILESTKFRRERTSNNFQGDRDQVW